MAKYIAQSNTNGKFYDAATGGFTAETACKASKLEEADLDRLDNLGFDFEEQELQEHKSWAVCYVRHENLDGSGNVIADRRNPSRRRFATKDEAIAHGSRFDKRVARKGDKPGTAGHCGFYVIQTNDPVNATVNPRTGLTNPLNA